MNTNSRLMLRNSLALLMAVRCRQEEAVKQLLASFYQTLDESSSRNLMMKSIYLMTPKERDYLKNLF